jgi:membrane fusion protein, multidrug efflux system
VATPTPDMTLGADAARIAEVSPNSDVARKWLVSLRTLLVSGAAIAIALGGAAWIIAAPTVETTDDAYVAADVTTVAPKVRGLVGEVLVRDNQAVHAGDPLVRIESEEFDARVSSAQADLADADAGIASVHAELSSLVAEEQLARANVTVAQTSIRSAAAEAARANADSERDELLTRRGAVSRREAETSHATAVSAEQAVARANAMFVVSQRQADVIAAKRPTLEAALAKADAMRMRSKAALDLAYQDQRHALIRAPLDGTVGNRQVRVGDYVQPGTRLLTLVPLQALYVTAYFKEKQTRRMRIGQPVTLAVDALDQPLSGEVESFAPGSGSTFSLLPFEPGTGNFTKIVQRVPVRIRFNSDQSRTEALRPGLSVTAKVRVAVP